MKKTVKVEFLKNKANQLLSSDMSIEEKYGVIDMIEIILHEADAYRGYMFLGSNPTPGNADYVYRKYF